MCPANDDTFKDKVVGFLEEMDHFDGILQPEGSADKIIAAAFSAGPNAYMQAIDAAFQVAAQNWPPKNATVGALFLHKLVDAHGFVGFGNYSYNHGDIEAERNFDAVYELLKKDYERNGDLESPHLALFANRSAENVFKVNLKWGEIYQHITDRCINTLTDLYVTALASDYQGVAMTALLDLTERNLSPEISNAIAQKISHAYAPDAFDQKPEHLGKMALIFERVQDPKAGTIKNKLIDKACRDDATQTYGRMLCFRTLALLIQKSPELLTPADIDALLTTTQKTVKNAVNLSPQDSNQLLADQMYFWSMATESRLACNDEDTRQNCLNRIHDIAQQADEHAQSFCGEDQNWLICLINARKVLEKTHKLTGKTMPSLTPNAQAFFASLEQRQNNLKAAILFK